MGTVQTKFRGRLRVLSLEDLKEEVPSRVTLSLWDLAALYATFSSSNVVLFQNSSHQLFISHISTHIPHISPSPC